MTKNSNPTDSIVIASKNECKRIFAWQSKNPPSLSTRGLGGGYF
ncbi:hypothetical protein [Helicobacter sp. T3_23-1056]